MQYNERESLFPGVSRYLPRPGGRPTGTTTTPMQQPIQPINPMLNTMPQSNPAMLPQEEAPGQIPQMMQSYYNLARGQIQGQTQTGMDYLRDFYSGRGLRPGESGIADRMIAKTLASGQQELGQRSTELALKGTEMQYGQEMDAMQMLMNLLGLQTQEQLGRWTPYWQAAGYGMGGFQGS